MMLSLTSSPLSLQHHVTRLLESNAYVRCLIVDFSKAFDTIDHVILLSKLKRLTLANNVLNLVIDF